MIRLTDLGLFWDQDKFYILMLSDSAESLLLTYTPAVFCYCGTAHCIQHTHWFEEWYSMNSFCYSKVSRGDTWYTLPVLLVHSSVH